MRILFLSTGTKAEPWLAALRRELPAAEVAEWQPGAAAADYAVVWAPPQQMFDEQPGLRAVFNTGAGVDALLARRLPPQALLVRLEDAGMSVQMAEYVCHAVIRHFREFDRIGQDVAQQRWAYRRPLLRQDFPVGVMGLGVLGARVAQALAQFDFPVLGWSRSPRQLAGVRCFAGAGQLEPFLQASRILVCLLPLTADTENILDRRTLGQLLPGGYLINVARGAHLVEEDLVGLLREGRLAGATLDVFRTEPLPAGHPFWQEPKITITPHTSARTLRDETVAQISRKIEALERGEPVAGVVDRLRGY
jgi:glyoxylate/hydroxypyruvate reductase A